MPTPLRNVRIEDAIWEPALAVATKRGESLSKVMRDALVRYIRKYSD
jgi:hypothetical protein